MRLAALTYEIMAGKNIEGAIAAVAGVLGYQGLRPQQEQALHVLDVATNAMHTGCSTE